MPSLPNLRELGGAPAGGNRTVRPGTLYRSTQLAGLAEHDRPVVEALGLAVVVDLRTAFEVQRAPDVPVTDTYVWPDVLHDFAMASTVGACARSAGRAANTWNASVAASPSLRCLEMRRTPRAHL